MKTTFKQFINEDDVEDRYNAQRLDSLNRAKVEDESKYSEYSFENADERYKFKGVYFDNERGLGNTPNGQEFKYRGFIAFISPNDFRSLVTHADDDVAFRGKKFVDLISHHKVSLATPMLYVNATKNFLKNKGDDSFLQITGHEGRGRMKAIGDIIGASTPVPVIIFIDEGPQGPWKRWDPSLKTQATELIKTRLCAEETENYFPVEIKKVDF